MQHPLFELNQVERIFALGATKVRALRSITLQIQHGEFVAIWGPSGSGKSTLLNMLGLIDKPDRGTLRFNGQNISELSDNVLSDFRNKKIGFVFQNFNLIPVLTALENVSLPLQVQNRTVKESHELASMWLEKVGLSHVLKHRPDRMSGGQRQRVAIARALVTSPQLLIADEPTANLDSKTGHEVIDLIEKLNQETNVTCVFTTHDPRLLSRVPRQLKLEDGEISTDNYKEKLL